MFKQDKVIIVGIDAATFDIIDELLDKGKLPNISRIMKKGVKGKLRSTIPTTSPAAWTSFSTGMNPGKHGIYDFINKMPNDYRFSVTSARDRRSKPLWTLLSEVGKKVCVVGCTLTYPPDKVNGCMVSGLGTPIKRGFPLSKSDFAFPGNLAEEIESRVGKYRIAIDINKSNISDGLKHNIKQLIDYRIKVNRYFFENYLSDFNFYFFGEIDLASHLLWEDKDFIFSLYEKVDGFIGELLNEKDANIILMSDHGAAKRERMFFVDRWLESEGFLVKKAGFFEKLKGLTKHNGRLSDIEWEKTKAFSGHSSVGGIFINLAGKEEKGCVPPGDYDNVRKEIVDRLMRLKDPKTGRDFVEKTHYKEVLFSGEQLDNAPDILITLKKGYGIGVKGIEDNNIKNEFIADSIYWRGDHEINGIFVAAGSAINEDMQIDGAEIIDISPTVMYLFGLPVFKDMDGKILMPIFKEEFVKSNPVVLSNDNIRGSSSQDNLTREEEKMIAESLKNLGYIE